MSLLVKEGSHLVSRIKPVIRFKSLGIFFLEPIFLCIFTKTRNKGAKTLASNAFRVGALAMVGGLTLFLGKCLVAICSGVCAGLMVRNFPDHPEGTD